MPHADLRRIFGRKKKLASILVSLIEASGAPIGISDAGGTPLIGQVTGAASRYPIVLGGETLGWVAGGPPAQAMAGLIAHLIAKESETKSLAGEVLDRYRELNLLYTLSEKLAASLDVKAVADMALSEAGRLIASGAGAVMLLDGEQWEHVAAFGSIDFQSHVDLLGEIVSAGRADIVAPAGDEQRIECLVCAPLKARQQVIGVILLAAEASHTYTAGDLKLLIALAALVAPAIENASIFERAVREAREREARLQQRIHELHIELDAALQARQVAEITETDYFQHLQARARDLRKGARRGE
ncbi:MAG TPA: GAF domain-containing protein [Anaerolineae bacterium]